LKNIFFEVKFNIITVYTYIPKCIRKLFSGLILSYLISYQNMYT